VCTLGHDGVFLGIQMLKSNKNYWGASNLEEKFEEKLDDDDAKLFQFFKIIWMKLPILNETHPNMWIKR